MSGAEVLRKVAEQRRERCRAIMADPLQARVCEGCSSLVYARSVVCPYCKSYRFNDDPAAIKAMASLLGERPLGFGCGVLPRLTTPRGLSAA